MPSFVFFVVFLLFGHADISYESPKQPSIASNVQVRSEGVGLMEGQASFEGLEVTY